MDFKNLAITEVKLNNEWENSYQMRIIEFKIKGKVFQMFLKKNKDTWEFDDVTHYIKGECEYCNENNGNDDKILNRCSYFTKHQKELYEVLIIHPDIRLRYLKYYNDMI